MRTARRQDAGEPEPERPDPVARAGQLMDAHEALAAKVRAALSCPQSAQAVDRLADEIIGLARHTGEMRGALEQAAVTAPSLKVAFDAGFEAGRAPQPAEAPAGPKHAASAKHLRLLPSVAAVGAVFRHSWAAAHPAATAAGAAAAVALTSAAVALPPSAPVAHHHAPLASSAVPGWRTPARHLSAPEASPRVRGPRPAAVKSTPMVTASPSSLPSVAVPPPPSPSVAPGVLAASDAVVDLRGVSQATVTLTAEGGPVSWSAGQQPGVVVDPGSGTLQAGESATVTVTATDLTHSGFAIVDLGGGVTLSVSWTAVAGLLGVARLL
jgi:hypothetical protein